MAVRKNRFAKIYTCFLDGLEGVEASVEISILPGLPSVDIVGLCDSCVRESKERVRASVRQLGYEFPSARITVGIFPSYIHKSGSSFDLPLAIGILMASGQIHVSDSVPIVAFGELSLTGAIRDTPGSIAKLSSIRNPEKAHVIVPESNRHEAKIMGMKVFAACCLKSVVCYLEHSESSKCDCRRKPDRIENNKTYISLNDPDTVGYDCDKAGCKTESDLSECMGDDIPDFSCLKGQEKASRALIIAAAGMHNLLMIGSPGSGKTTAARVLSGLLPPMNTDERIDHLKIIGVSRLLNPKEITSETRPFRYVHHSITLMKLIGDVVKHIPGELAMSAHGILFLDEMAEFNPRVLDALRQPLEQSRDSNSISFHSILCPSRFLLVGAMNPCKCGRLLDAPSTCTCSVLQKKQYYRRISGPILDRIDLFCEMHRLDRKGLYESISSKEGTESLKMREQVKECWDRQSERCVQHGLPPSLNGDVTGYPIHEIFRIGKNVLEYAVDSAERMRLSARGLNKLLRVGRTIADLSCETDVLTDHISEALLFRNKRILGEDMHSLKYGSDFMKGGLRISKIIK